MSAPAMTGIAPESASNDGGTTRPVGVSVVAIISFVTAAGAVAFGFFAIAFGAAMGSFFGTEGATLGASIGALVATFSLIGGAIAALMGYGLWMGRSWAWILTLIFEGMSGISALFGAARGDTGSLIAVAVAGVIFWYFFQPEVKRYFKM